MHSPRAIVSENGLGVFNWGLRRLLNNKLGRSLN